MPSAEGRVLEAEAEAGTEEAGEAGSSSGYLSPSKLAAKTNGKESKLAQNGDECATAARWTRTKQTSEEARRTQSAFQFECFDMER